MRERQAAMREAANTKEEERLLPMVLACMGEIQSRLDTASNDPALPPRLIYEAAEGVEVGVMTRVVARLHAAPYAFDVYPHWQYVPPASVEGSDDDDDGEDVITSLTIEWSV